MKVRFFEHGLESEGSGFDLPSEQSGKFGKELQFRRIFREGLMGPASLSGKILSLLKIGILTTLLTASSLEIAEARNSFALGWDTKGGISEVGFYPIITAPANQLPTLVATFRKGDTIEADYLYNISVTDRKHPNGSWITTNPVTLQVPDNGGTSFTLCNGLTINAHTITRPYGTFYIQTGQLEINRPTVTKIYFCPSKTGIVNLGLGKRYRVYLTVNERYISHGRWSVWTNGDSENLNMILAPIANSFPDLRWYGNTSSTVSIDPRSADAGNDKTGYIVNAYKPISIAARVSGIESTTVSTGEPVPSVTANEGAQREAIADYNGLDRPLGDNFKYGTWYLSGNYQRYRFRPNVSAIDKIPPGTVVTSELHYFWTDEYCYTCALGNVAKDEVQVTITTPALELSLPENSSPVVEGGIAKFTVKANTYPGSETLSVTYTPANASGNFLDSSPDPANPGVDRSSGVNRTTNLTFELRNNVYTADLWVPTKSANERFDGGGAVSVTLVAGPNYAVASGFESSMASVIDDVDKPEISLMASYSTLSDTDFIEFTVQSDVVTNVPLPVYTTLSDEDSIGVLPGATMFNLANTVTIQPGRSQALGQVRLTGTEVATSGNMVSVSLNTNSVYDIDTENDEVEYLVVRGRNLPTVGVAGRGAVSEGTPAVFSLSIADEPMHPRTGALRVNIRVFQGPDEDFILGIPLESVSIQTNEDAKLFEILTQMDSDNAASDGLITVVVVPGVGYKLANSGTTATVEVEDNDGIPIVEFASSTTNVGESAGILRLALSMPAASTGLVSATIGISAGTATSGLDFTIPANRRVDFPAGRRSAVFAIPILSDTKKEMGETFTLTLASVTGGAKGEVDTLTVTIDDDDSAPQVEFTADSLTRSVNEGANVELTVGMSAATTSDITVIYSTSDGTATSGTGGDYTAPTIGSTVVFQAASPDMLTQTISIPISTDGIQEPNETFTVNITLQTGTTDAVLGAGSAATVTISDSNGDPEVNMVGISTGVSESIGSVSISIRLGHETFHEVGVVYSATSGTAMAGADFMVVTSARVGISAGNTRGSLLIPIIQDTDVEESETFTVTIVSASNGSLGTTLTNTVTISDDDTAPSVSFASSSYSFAENAGTAELVVNLTGASFRDIQVTYNTAVGTADSNDFTGTNSGTTTISGGMGNRTGTISIPIINNDAPSETEAMSETFTVTLTGATNGSIDQSNKVTTVTIIDDTGAAIITFDSGSTALSAAEGSGTVTLTVNLSESVDNVDSVLVEYATQDVSATGSTVANTGDYMATGLNTLTFDQSVEGSEETTKSFSVAINEDSEFEENETFKVILSHPQNAIFANGATTISVTVTITDNDSSPTVTIAQDDRTLSVTEDAGTVSLTVNLTSATYQQVTVAYGISGSGGFSTSDIVDGGAGQLVMEPGAISRDIVINITNDLDFEESETFTVTLADSTANAVPDGSAAATTSTITIMPDDDIRPSVGFTSSSIITVEGELPAEKELGLTFSAGTYETVRVEYTIIHDTASISDYTDPGSGSVNIGPNSTRAIPIGIVNDSNLETEEMFRIRINSVFHVDGSSNKVPGIIGNVSIMTVTINSDAADGTPMVGFKDGSTTVSVTEGTNANAVLEVGLTAETHLSVMVEYTVTAVAAAPGNTELTDADYTPPAAPQSGNRSITIAPGTTIGEIVIGIVDDPDYETAEAFNVQIVGWQNARAGSALSSTVTISSDDLRPLARFATESTSKSVMENNPAGFVELTLELTGNTYEEVTVNFLVAGETATINRDFVAPSSQSVEFNGVSSKSIRIAIQNEDYYEADETFRVTIVSAVHGSSVTGGIDNEDVAHVTILNDDSLPRVGFRTPTASATEGAADSVSLTLVMSNQSYESVTVNYAVVTVGHDLATNLITASDSDIIGESSASIVFPPESTSLERSITIGIVNDSNYEQDEMFEVRITTVTHAEFASANLVSRVTIYSDTTDEKPEVGFAETSIDLSGVEETTRAVPLTVELTAESYEPVTVQYEVRTVDHASAPVFVTASDNDLNSQLAGTLTFEPGTTSNVGDITIEIAADLEIEVTEFFVVTLFSPQNASLADPSEVMFTIFDATKEPTVEFSLYDQDREVNEGNRLELRLELSNAFSQDVVINYSIVNPNAGENLIDASPTDYVDEGGGSVTVSSGLNSGTISIFIPLDQLYEKVEGLAVQLNDIENGKPGPVSKATITIFDMDGPPGLNFVTSSLVTSRSYPSYSIAEDDGLARLSVRMSHRSTSAVNFRVRTQDIVDTEIAENFATAGVDYSELATRNLSIPPGQLEVSFSVSISTDSEDEPDESFLVVMTVGNLGGAQFASNDEEVRILVTIINDDALPVISISVAEDFETITEGQHANFIVTATPPPIREPLVVQLRSEVSGDFVMFRIPRSISIRTGDLTDSSRMTRLAIGTMDDLVVEPAGGSVTIEVLADNGTNSSYLLDPVADNRRKTVVVQDNDTETVEPVDVVSVAGSAVQSILQFSGNNSSDNQQRSQSLAQLPKVHIFPVDQEIEEGEPAQFALVLSKVAKDELSIRVELEGDDGKFLGSRSRSVEVGAGQTRTTLIVHTVDDDVAGDDEVVTATIRPGPGYEFEIQDAATVVISDQQDRNLFGQRLSAVSREVLPSVMTSVGNRNLEVTSERVAAAYNGDVGNTFRIGSADSAGDLITLMGESMNDGRGGWKSVFGDSSVAVNLFPENGVTPSTTFWAVGDHGQISDWTGSQSQFQDSDLLSGHVGIDTRLDNGGLLGLSTSTYLSEFRFEDSPNDSLNFNVSSTELNPYVGFQTSNGNSSILASLGYGLSAMGIDRDYQATEHLSGSYYNAFVTGSQQIFQGAGILGGKSQVKVKGSTWFSKQSMESTGRTIVDLQLGVGQFALVVEGQQSHNFANSILVPSVAVGFGRDVTELYTRDRLQLDTALEYRNYGGFTLTGSGGLFVGEANSVERWETKGLVSYDHNLDDLGVQLEFIGQLGTSGPKFNDSYWYVGPVNSMGRSWHSENGDGLESEIGYGIELTNGAGILTPFGGISHGYFSGNEVRIGSRLMGRSAFELKIEGSRSFRLKENASQKIEFSGRYGW